MSPDLLKKSHPQIHIAQPDSCNKVSKANFSDINFSDINFLRKPLKHCLRRHFRAGLRSDLFELIRGEDIQAEHQGKIIDNIQKFPRAKPIKMLRVLKNRFDSLDQALEEIKKYRLLLKFLGSGLVARSEEFIVEYKKKDRSQILLCGLQEYIEGTILDPWHLTNQEALKHFYTPDPTVSARKFISQATTDIKAFVRAISTMIRATGHIPDLAGDGNLMLTRTGSLKLVDINNIIKIEQGPIIQLDDKGYPCCDKSVEVLSILEHRILKQPISLDHPFYGSFFVPERKEQVKKLEQAFYQSLTPPYCQSD